ncbi:oligoendopeptidase F [Verrucomicrobium sp. GAS474]|uniref:M3 family oligoendopeptidase n=1 Tax=Verrucomicrobium sp. GAS474 TaxID=1882831 RepID=UPI00087B5EBC|nr:M3 family oligoendopeptidase [Verrucomicrobium sp. GAS474]SDU14255.1 oligoendopeptidase F [Verrucomicrobium sp. GAS474]
MQFSTAPYSPRTYLPAGIDLTDLKTLEGLYGRLQADLEAAATAAELETWLASYGEVDSAIDQARSERYIAMTCQTDDPEREKAYLHFVEELDPALKPRQFALWQTLVAKPAFEMLPDYYAVFRRSVATAVRLYREQNIPRETATAKLCQSYQKISGAMTVTFDGAEQTLPRMGRIQEETDRARRQAAWEAVAARRLADSEKLEEIFDQLLVLREEIAKEAGFADARAYFFASRERFDYTPDDCLRFHDAIEKQIVPLVREMQAERKAKLGVDTLRPWDLAVDPEARPPLKPFATGDELFEKTDAIFGELDPRLKGFFDVLRQGGLVDLENRKGKAPGGYQANLPEARVPFIFMNAVGMQRDVETLLHEAGHAFHTLAAREQPMNWYRNGIPIEFCEVASMSMELLGAPYMGKFYNEEESKRARRDHLEGIVKFFPWMAIVDGFQHWLYTHPGHSRPERKAAWIALMDRFGGIEDWTGLGDLSEARAYLWHRQLHIFELPFYYVEYGIAQLGALQVWSAAHKDRKAAIDAYLSGLSLGGSKPLPQLFEGAGIAFDFTDKTIAPLIALVREEMAKLG